MKIFSYLLAVLPILGCAGEEGEKIPEPVNLQVQVDVSNNGSGHVSVTATAENTNYYYIFFGDAVNEIATVSLDGKAEHTYVSSGSYSVKVEAHATAPKYINKNTAITVMVNEVIDIIDPGGYTTPLMYDNMNLVWSDEFNGTMLNENDWTFEIGTGGNGWGNNELEYYRKENTVVHDGLLIIAAKKEAYMGRSYTSSRIKTQGKKAFTYGRIDIRAVLPEGQGLWPALWMLGSSISTVGWPACGETDIMEMIGGSNREKTVYGTLHWDNNGHACSCNKPGYTLSSGTYHDKFHVFSIVWTATSVKWYVDDVIYNTVDINDANLSELKAESFFIFNVAVGGDWPGSPDATTVFPQHMIVDYIRVFQGT